MDGLIKEVSHTLMEDRPTIYAVRYGNFGLTAYGNSEEEAEKNLSEMLGVFLSNLFMKSIMNERLEKAGIQWRWTNADWVPPQTRWITQGPPSSISVSTAVLAAA